MSKKREIQVWRRNDGARLVVQYQYSRGGMTGHTFDLGVALSKHDNMFEGLVARAIKLQESVK